MFRNKEYRLLLSLMIGLGVVTVGLCSLYSVGASGIVAVSWLVMIILHGLYNRKRYQKLEDLSCYLHRIATGEYTLDLRDNEEGELSILKNEIYKVTQRLLEQNELMLKDKSYLADAISDISHQLKTPLTSMMTMTELLSKNDLEQGKRLMFAKNIKRQLERLEWLVGALLKLSKIDAGTIAFKKERIVLRELIEAAAAPIEIPMEIKEQQLVICGSETMLVGDYQWTTEALVNILKNCMEHTPVGGRITVSYTGNPIYTEIIIEDTGEGINSEDLPHIFERFYRGKNASNESVGIGLAMARSIVVRQNGDITVTSEVGSGTTFRIRFYKQVV